MKKVIIFGYNQFAQLANFYLNDSSEYNVIAFTVHKEFKKDNYLYDKPIIDFEDLENIYDTKEYYLFAPISGKGLNKIREQIYYEGKKKGYRFISYISKYATVLTKNIGENCFILEDNTIQPFVEIGNNCILWSGNHIGHHTKIMDHVFITSHVVISGNCLINKYSWFGVNSTIRDNLIIEEGSLISMGACVTKNTESYNLYIGIPAKSIGSSNEDKIKNNL